jgi:hypothetical protein
MGNSLQCPKLRRAKLALDQAVALASRRARRTRFAFDVTLG